jgi:uncharacterized protein (DUF362 family)
LSPARREFLKACAGSLGLAGCRRRPEPLTPAPVSIRRAPAYGPELYGTLRSILAEHKLQVRGKRILLKPNLVEFDPATAVNTHPVMVHAALEAFKSLGAAEVRIAEGPGHRRNTLELAEAAGYFETAPGFESLFTDLNLDEISQVSLAGGHSPLRSLYMPNTALGADLVVSMPKMKTHHWVGATLSMKNFFGVVPGAVYGWPKNVLHWAGINECVADLYTLFPSHFAIVDGIVGMEGNGPIQGTPKQAGVIVAGSDLVSVDATCCRIMAIDPEKIGYLKMAAGQRLGEASAQQIGERLQDVRTPFALIREFEQIRLG